MGNANGVDLHKTEVPQIDQLLSYDAYLKPFETEIRRRYGCFIQYMEQINNYEQGLLKFTESYKQYGVHVDANNNVTCLEWAPNAKNVYLRGDFSIIFKKLSFHFYYKCIYN
jgi:1,4-alpha-glucan branching enzyme